MKKYNTSPRSQVYQPVAVEIEMTHQCNLRCNGCAILDDVIKAKYELSSSEILEFLDEAKSNRLKSYALTGGEPFLRLNELKKIISQSYLDLIKVNTNGFIFSTPKITKKILEELKEAGYAYRNEKIKSWLHVSVGQQTAQGIPLENAIFVAREFYNIFSPEKAGFSLNVFSPSERYLYYIIETFLKKYKAITGKDLDTKKVILKLIPSDGRYCSTACKLKAISDRKSTIHSLIDNYLGDKHLWINCFERKKLTRSHYVAPRMLLRADGSLYSCTGFAHVHWMGNIHNERLEDILSRANNNVVLKTVFQYGLKGLLRLAEKYQPGIGKQKISISNGPCDICRILSNTIQLHS